MPRRPEAVYGEHMIEPGDIQRLLLGYYTMPPDSRLAGQKIVACAYLIRHANGLLLFDTGIGTGHAAAEQEFGPIHRRPLRAELGRLGLEIGDVSAVANCHLHLDHCGGNPLFAGTPIFIQRQELDAMPSLDYILPGMVDFPGVALEIHDGDAELAPGLQLIHTPGHTPGHQSLLATTPRGTILLAGQAMGDASDYGRAQFSLDVAAAAGPAEAGPQGAAGAGTDPPAWLRDLQELDIQRVLFAHDILAWDAPQARGTG
jgi:N-acyl homoserine lactone hydrolase